MSIGIEMAAGGMAVSKTPCSRSSGERWDRDSSWRDGCQKTPRSRATYLALISDGIAPAAGEMAVGKMPCVGALVSVGIETPAGEMAVG